ncbi:hypothetical protein GDO81_027863 [Engystomops pustulosus]|uniref:Uncharacterized protein n=1 Tax=Engystomops pustulosus TaxID=76066 RepID=A0AAV6YG92_ENGPU|nr:hypothetical protein GDO81_027863 [Engystomops pustulosus]
MSRALPYMAEDRLLHSSLYYITAGPGRTQAGTRIPCAARSSGHNTSRPRSPQASAPALSTGRLPTSLSMLLPRYRQLPGTSTASPGPEYRHTPSTPHTTPSARPGHFLDVDLLREL